MSYQININKNDHSINDYLFCLSSFSKNPNQINIFDNFSTERFLEYISNLPPKSDTIIKEMIPMGDGEYMENIKHFIEINPNFFISFLENDKTSDGYVTDLIIYYTDIVEEDVNKFIEDTKEFIIDATEEEYVSQKFNLLTLTQDGLQLEPFDVKVIENIEFLFNEDVLKAKKKLIKKINKSEKGLSVIYGNRGTGKTTLVSSIIQELDKLCIFIPSNMIDAALNTNDFKNLMKRYKNSVIVFDDCEMFFTSSQFKANIFTNNLIQFVDGISSSLYNIQIITILNVEDIDEIDENLLDCNNLIGEIEVDNLTPKKVDELCKQLDHKNKFSSSTRLVDVVKKRYDESTKKIGY